MLKLENTEIFHQTVAEAIAKCSQDLRGRKIENWVRQIARAAYEIETNQFLSYNAKTGKLYIVSRSSLESYVVSRVCCRKNGNLCPARSVCWHLICRRLYALYLERLEASKADSILDAQVVFDDEYVSAETVPAIRKVFQTDERGREFYVEKCGAISVSERIYV